MPGPDQEVELKFVLPPEQAEDVWARIGGAPDGAVALTSVYFDTARRDLRKTGIGLRVREKRGSFIQAVKSGHGLQRGEWETTISGAAPDRTALAGTPAARLLPDHVKLAPLFSVRAQRRTIELDQGASRIEVCVDLGEIRAGAAAAPLCEIELELMRGEVSDLFTLARRLGAESPLTLSFASKAARGYALADPDPPALPGLTGSMTAAEGFQALGQTALQGLTEAAVGFLQSPGPEPVHRLRIALRRLRGAITVFKPVCVDAAQAGIKAELAWLAGQMDVARDLDVLIGETLPAHTQGVPTEAVRALEDRLAVARTDAYAAAELALTGPRYRALLLATLEWLIFGPWTAEPALAEARNCSLKGFVGQRLEAWRDRLLDKGRRLAKLSAEDRHHLRIAGKKLRYGLEDLGAVLAHAKRQRRLIKGLKALQDALGALNDANAGAARLAGLAADFPSEDAGLAGFAAGALAAALQGDGAAQLKAAKIALHRLKAVGPVI